MTGRVYFPNVISVIKKYPNSIMDESDIDLDEVLFWRERCHIVRVTHTEEAIKGQYYKILDGELVVVGDIHTIIPRDEECISPEPGDHPVNHFRNYVLMADYADEDGRIPERKQERNVLVYVGEI